jgi:hypothetical protein
MFIDSYDMDDSFGMVSGKSKDVGKVGLFFGCVWIRRILLEEFRKRFILSLDFSLVESWTIFLSYTMV